MSVIQVHERIDTKKKSWYYRFETPSINGKRQTIKKSGFKTKKKRKWLVIKNTAYITQTPAL